MFLCFTNDGMFSEVRIKCMLHKPIAVVLEKFMQRFGNVLNGNIDNFSMSGKAPAHQAGT
jgi:hypothetical protein